MLTTINNNISGFRLAEDEFSIIVGELAFDEYEPFYAWIDNNYITCRRTYWPNEYIVTGAMDATLMKLTWG